MSSSRPMLRLIPLTLAVLLLAACGNKGDLVKPTPKPTTPPAQPATPAPAVPATSATPATPATPAADAGKH
jgi:hypothetical protein